MIKNFLQDFLNSQKQKVVAIDFNNNTISYDKKIKQYREIKRISGTEELVRAYLIARLVNHLGYKPEDIEIEKGYDLGRPKVNKPRIDVIVRDRNGNAFLYIELKSPEEFEKNKDEVIEKQLFSLAAQEIGQGKKVKYLALYTFEEVENTLKDKALIIDYDKLYS